MSQEKKVVRDGEIVEAQTESNDISQLVALLRAQIQGSAEMQALLRLMAEREAKTLVKDKALDEARERKEKARQASAEQTMINKKLSQVRCKHRKPPRPGAAPDYAVYLHTFIDGTQRIKCQKCSMYWVPQDTATHLFRDGKQVPNHTKVGWNEALAMLDQTTNKPSSSEVPMTGVTMPGRAPLPAQPALGIIDVEKASS
jgi:hypothetical protein